MSPPPKILVVDDDLEHLSLSGILLRRGSKDLEIRTATNGREAVGIIEEEGVPNLILMDTDMPVLTGPDACTEIREQYDVPIVALSTYIRNLSKWAGAGFSRFNTKKLHLHDENFLQGIARSLVSGIPLYDVVVVGENPLIDHSALPLTLTHIDPSKIDTYHAEGGLGLVYLLSLPKREQRSLHHFNRLKRDILNQRPDAYLFFVVNQVDPTYQIGFRRYHDDMEQIIPQITPNQIYPKVINVLDQRHLVNALHLLKNEEAEYVVGSRRGTVFKYETLETTLNELFTTFDHLRVDFTTNGGRYSPLSLSEQARANEMWCSGCF